MKYITIKEFCKLKSISHTSLVPHLRRGDIDFIINRRDRRAKLILLNAKARTFKKRAERNAENVRKPIDKLMINEKQLRKEKVLLKSYKAGSIEGMIKSLSNSMPTYGANGSGKPCMELQQVNSYKNHYQFNQ
jgi:hypothetical protein